MAGKKGTRQNQLKQTEFFKLCMEIKNDLTKIRASSLSLDQMKERYPNVCDFPIQKGTFQRAFKAIEEDCPSGSQATMQHTKTNPMSIAFKRIDAIKEAILLVSEEQGVRADIESFLDW